MIFKDQHNLSYWHKSVFTICVLAIVSMDILLMFMDNSHSFAWLEPYQISGDLIRRTLIASCLIIYLLRLQVTVWIFQKRKWTWLETMTITVLMSFVLYAFAKVGGNNKQVVGGVEVIGMLLYLIGSYINTHSEYSRHVWKSKEVNKEKGTETLSNNSRLLANSALILPLTIALVCKGMDHMAINLGIIKATKDVNITMAPRIPRSGYCLDICQAIAKKRPVRAAIAAI